MMRNLFFVWIKRHLTANIPELKQLEMYHNQERNRGALRATPAMFVKFHPTQWRPLTMGIQEGNVEFDLMLFSKTEEDGEPRIFNNGNKDHYDLVNDVNKHIAGKSARLSSLAEFAALADTENDRWLFNSIMRIRDEDNTSKKQLLQTNQRFKCLVKDFSGCPTYSKLLKEDFTLKLLEKDIVSNN